MERSKLKIVSPCSQDFDQMQGEGFRRFCDQCDKHVHNLSDLTRAEAVELIRSNQKGEMCVVYTFDSSDRIRFRDDLGFRRPSKAQLSGLKKLLAAAAFIPLLATLPACDTGPIEEPASMFGGYQSGADAVADYKPIDDLMAAEQRFVDRIKDLLGFVPEYEMMAGAPMIAEDFKAPEPVPEPEDMLMGEIAAPDEPMEEPTSGFENLVPELREDRIQVVWPNVPIDVEPPDRMIMGDMIAPDDLQVE